MGASCKGICNKLSINKIPNALKYQFGLKRCSWCEIWIDTEDVRCPCCRMILRTRARGRKRIQTGSIA